MYYLHMLYYVYNIYTLIQLQIQFVKLLQRDVLPTPERVKEFIDGAKSIMRAMADGGYSDWKGQKKLTDVSGCSCGICISFNVLSK